MNAQTSPWMHIRSATKMVGGGTYFMSRSGKVQRVRDSVFRELADFYEARSGALRQGEENSDQVSSYR